MLFAVLISPFHPRLWFLNMMSILGRWISYLLIVSLVIVVPMSCQADEMAANSDVATTLQYPVAVAVDGSTLYVVDLDLPGVWQMREGQQELFVRGSQLLRKPLNRPRCVAVHPAGGILVGDSATREIYHISSRDAEPKPLSNSAVGIPMAIAVSPDGESIYVGDAERRSVLRLPIGGGEPQEVVRVNARGLAFDGDGMLWRSHRTTQRFTRSM